MLDIVNKLVKMETKKYKIWRFAYLSHVDELILPSEMKLYQLDKSSDIANMYYYAKEIDKEVVNYSYVGTMPYSDEAWKILHDYKQTFNIKCYNIFDNDIIVHVNQVYPLTDDFPVTDEYPHIGISYFEQRNRVDRDTDDYIRFHKKNKNNPDYEKLAEDFFYPVTKYVKIQGIDKKFPLMLDVYELILTTKLDYIPFEGLTHTIKNIDNVLPSEYNSQVKGKKITQEQYKFACAKQIGLICG